jgi:four helix bundle protein
MNRQVFHFQSHKDLFVWKQGMGLFRMIHDIAGALPTELRWTMGPQMIRASISIPSNIAEGYNAGSAKQWHKYLYIAYGSACELDTQLLMTSTICPSLRTRVDSCRSLLLSIRKMLYALIHQHKSSKPLHLTSPTTHMP